MHRIQSSFQPPRQMSYQDSLLEERRKSARLVELSAAFAFQGTKSEFPRDNEVVSPLRSPKKRVKTVKFKRGIITASDEDKSKPKGTEKEKWKVAKAESKPASTHHKFVAEDMSSPSSRVMSEAEAPAAVQIQRIARGWYQRLLYRIMWLQNQLDTSDERKRLALQRIDDRLHIKKYTYRDKFERKSIASVTAASKGTKEAKDLIAHLRKSNKKLRERNQKVYNSIHNLKFNNISLEKANAETLEYYGQLKEHVEQLEVNKRNINEGERNYKAALEKVEEGIALREQYYQAEHKVKTCYAQTIATIVDLADERAQDDFAEALFELCLHGLEGYESVPLPQQPSAPKSLQKDDATSATADSDSDSDRDSDSESSIE